MLAEQPLDPSVAPVRELPVIAHLATRWDPTWHRPHRLLRAMGAQAPVLVIEESVVLDDVRRERLDLSEVAPGVIRALPRLPAYLREQDRAAATVSALLRDALRNDARLRGRFTGAVQWFTRATSAHEFLDQFGEVGVVLDCLVPDASGISSGAERGSRERALLSRADLVLTSADRLAAFAAEHGTVVAVDDGVDAARWGAPDVATAPPPDVASLPRPVLGYLGPVDDRLDHAHLRALLAAAGEGSVVLVGPPGRPPADGSIAPPLPRGVRWLGARDEALLPAYLRAFDACVFPMAAGHPTLAMDPPAVLECLAAGRPVVSSVAVTLPGPLADFVHAIAEPRAFAARAMEAAATPAIGDTPVLTAVLAEGASWDQVTRRIRGALFEAIAARPTPLSSIADALIAGRVPPGTTPDAR
jgi:glycosyltransferase involved in cell wall biosynthesis